MLAKSILPTSHSQSSVVFQRLLSLIADGFTCLKEFSFIGRKRVCCKNTVLSEGNNIHRCPWLSQFVKLMENAGFLKKSKNFLYLRYLNLDNLDFYICVTHTLQKFLNIQPNHYQISSITYSFTLQNFTCNMPCLNKTILVQCVKFNL